MARLRRRSSDNLIVYDDHSDYPARSLDRTARTYSQKQANAQIPEDCSVPCEDTSPPDRVQESRHSKGPNTKRRQIRLAPLNQLKSASAGLQIRVPASSSHQATQETKLSSRKPQIQSRDWPVSNSASIKDLQDTISGSEVQEDLDESDFELPDPKDLLKSQQVAVTNQDTIKALVVDSSDDDVVRHKRPVRPRRSSESSSDKENGGDAILRFSPAQTHNRLVVRPSTPPPSSPTKRKLVSPSKRPPQIPTPPFRPSLDAFWDIKTINEWNDQYSPRKDWKSPRKPLSSSNDDTPTTSPCKQAPSSPMKRSKAEIEARKAWDATKDSIARAFLSELDKTIADSQIATLAAETGGVQIAWSKTLNSTAGRANWRRETVKTRQADGTAIATSIKHFAAIELAEKVIDDEDRLLNVLAHEFCHLCNFMISNIRDQPHGKQFKAWGAKTTKAFAHRGVKVTTKHTYEIEYKYIWSCDECGQEYKRHSRSVDVVKHKCGKCRGKLTQIKPVPRKNGNPDGGYAKFVKDNFKRIKDELGPGKTQGEVMEAVGRHYREDKAKKSNSGVEDVVRKLAFITID